jgi:hypothetical protein
MSMLLVLLGDKLIIEEDSLVRIQVDSHAMSVLLRLGSMEDLLDLFVRHELILHLDLFRIFRVLLSEFVGFLLSVRHLLVLEFRLVRQSGARSLVDGVLLGLLAHLLVVLCLLTIVMMDGGLGHRHSVQRSRLILLQDVCLGIRQ